LICLLQRSDCWADKTEYRAFSSSNKRGTVWICCHWPDKPCGWGSVWDGRQMQTPAASWYWRSVIYQEVETWPKKQFILNVCCVLLFCVYCVVLSVCFCTGHFVMLPLSMTLSSLLFIFELLFSLYYNLLFKYLVVVFCSTNILLSCPQVDMFFW